MSGAARVIRNTSLMVASELVIKGFNLVFYMLLARRLGTVGMGRWTVSLTLVGLLLYLFNFGLTTLFTRESAGHAGETQSLIDRFLPLRLWLAAAALVALLPVAWLARHAMPPALVLIFGAAAAVALVGDLMRAVFRSRQKLEYEAGLNLLERSLASALGVSALLLGAGIVATAASFSLGSITAAAVAGILVWRSGLAWAPKLTVPDARRLLRQAVPLVLLSLFATVYYRQDVLILRALRSESEVGLYAAAYRLFDMFVFLPGSLAMAYLPAASAALHEPGDRFRVLFRRTLGLTFTLSAPLAVALWFRAPDVVRALFGPAFAGAVAPARVLVWQLPLYFANMVLWDTLVAGRLQRLPALCVGSALVVNAALNFALIPRLGMMGAAWASLGTEGLLFAIQGVLVARSLAPWNLAEPLARPALACAALAGVLWWCRALPFGWAFALAGAAYLAAGAALRMWHVDELRALLAWRTAGESP